MQRSAYCKPVFSSENLHDILKTLSLVRLIQIEYLKETQSGSQASLSTDMRRGIFSVHLFLKLLANLTSNAFASGFLLVIPLNMHA